MAQSYPMDGQGAQAGNGESFSSLKQDLEQWGKISQKVADDSLEQLKKSFQIYYAKSHDKLGNVEQKVEETTGRL